MKKRFRITILLSVMLCSCSPDKGAGTKVITPEQAHTAVVKFLYNRGFKDNLRIVSERMSDREYTYRFMTNGVEVTREVVVNRHTGRAEMK